MANLNEIYKCNLCGNMVQAVGSAGGTLSCCGQEMELLEPRQLEEGGAKHIPVVTKEDDKIVVNMGEIPHPMEEEHYIQFIILNVGEKIYRANLNPGDEPKAVFDINAEPDEIKAIAYCNIHGLWHD